MIVIFLGAPGSGKGTQAKLVAHSLGYAHLSTGDLLRSAIVAKSELGRLVEPILAAGKFVDDKIVLDLVRESLERNIQKPGIVFDGYPRSVSQAQALDKVLDELGLSVDRVIHLNVPDHNIVDRLVGRFSCKSCGAPYHTSNPPKVMDQCDFCGSHEFSKRSDDTPETVGARLEKYHQEASPILDFYHEKGVVVPVDGCQSVTKIQSEIRLALEVSPKEAKYS